MKKVISVVVPVYNEAVGIQQFLMRELVPELEKMGREFEIVIVNDGSVDGTLAKIAECDFGKIRKKVVTLTRNFGKEVALSVGLLYAEGEAAIMIDADGQHPVEAIPKMVAAWEKGARVVTAVRGGNTTKHKMGSRLYYWMMRKMGQKNLVVGAMDFRLVDRAVIDEFNRFTERNRLTRGLIDWLGFEQVYIKVETKKRLGGKPTYSFGDLTRLAGDSLVSVSRTPLLIFGYIGMFIMAASMALGLFILVQQYIMGDPLGLDWSGAVAMSVFIAFLVGLVLVSQAMTALYISQIHIEAKNRPLFVVDVEKSVGVAQKQVDKKEGMW